MGSSSTRRGGGSGVQFLQNLVECDYHSWYMEPKPHRGIYPNNPWNEPVTYPTLTYRKRLKRPTSHAFLWGTTIESFTKLKFILYKNNKCHMKILQAKADLTLVLPYPSRISKLTSVFIQTVEEKRVHIQVMQVNLFRP